jgi:hypothetical protein
METAESKTELPSPNADNHEKDELSHEDLRIPPDIETAREGVEQHPPMTFKRFMAIFSLGCLLAAAQIPLYLIGASICNLSRSLSG